jgi:hypothetical protein
MPAQSALSNNEQFGRALHEPEIGRGQDFGEEFTPTE